MLQVYCLPLPWLCVSSDNITAVKSTNSATIITPILMTMQVQSQQTMSLFLLTIVQLFVPLLKPYPHTRMNPLL